MVRGPSPEQLPGELVNGAIVGFGISYMLRRMYPGSFSTSRALSKLKSGSEYMAVFLRELLTANLDVARRVLSPSMPIEPAVVEYRLEVTNPLAVTVLANSITLTPGTLTLDHEPERGVLRVHAIDGGSNPDEVRAPIRRWERLIQEMMGERQ
jgi:multicomponent Na+:H+ antiporter subunit E